LSEPVPTPTIPRWLPALLFAALTLVAFRVFIFSNGMLLGSDTLNGGYAARAFYAEQLRSGTFPRWAPDILGGTPFLEALSGGDALYPTSLLLVLVEPFRALGWKLVLHVLLAGFLMFAWLRTVGASRAAALFSGTAYMLAPFFVSLVRPGHDGKLFVTALTPLLFLVVERFFTRPRARGFCAIALVVMLVLFTTHFQMAYFLFGAVGVFAAYRAVRLVLTGETDASAARSAGHATVLPRAAALRFGLFLAASVTGLAGAAVQVVPAVDYVTNYSRRTQTTSAASGETGEAWSSSWSLHPEEAMGLVIPEFAGNGAGGAAWAADTYWGRNFLKDNAEYGGILVLLLAAVSFAGAERRALRWFLAATGGLALLYALGAHTPIWRVAYAVLPGIRLFRSPSMAVFLFGFAAATLAGLGLDLVFRAAAEGGAVWRRVARVLGVGAGLLVVLALLVSSGALLSLWTSVVYRDIDAARLEKLGALRPFITRGAWLAAVVALLAALLPWALRHGRVRPALLLGAFLFLTAVDELRVDGAFVQVIDFARWVAPDPTTEAVLSRERDDPDPYRLLSFVDRGQDVRPALYGIELAAGHHPNDLARYRELIGMSGSDLPRNLTNPNIERLLNVRWLVWPDYHGAGPPEDDVVLRTTREGRPWMTLHARPGLPRARLLGRAVVKPEDEQVPYMLSAAFDPEHEVVLGAPPPVALDGGTPVGSVTWVTRTPNELGMDVTTDRAALVVVADNWFPAWHATVDGQPAPLLRAYHAVRAVPVPPGRHSVRMVYRSGVVAASLPLSVGVLTLLLATLVWTSVAGRGPAQGDDAPPDTGRS